MTRIAKVERNTSETRIELRVDLDGSAKTDIETGIGFLESGVF